MIAIETVEAVAAMVVEIEGYLDLPPAQAVAKVREYLTEAVDAIVDAGGQAGVDEAFETAYRIAGKR